MAGFASNVSLAFLLGMTNPVGMFFGIPIDVRHVTLSTGAMTAACASIGGSVFSQHIFWHAVLGLISMAVLNLAVSFALALTVAVWAKKATAPSRRVIYKELAKRLITAPWILLLPLRKIETAI